MQELSVIINQKQDCKTDKECVRLLFKEGVMCF
jgi:hypothetical protein